MNKNRICTTCGTQYNNVTQNECPICLDDRQYVPESGQSWTNLEELLQKYSVIVNELHDRLYEIKSAPVFGIGQRALLVISPQGNVLWDCIAVLNEPLIEFIKSKGGVQCIAISHPHYYTTMNEWAAVFNCPIHLHKDDEQWIFNKGERVSCWSGDKKMLWDGMKIINIGGHFPGSCMLHVPFLSEEGALLCGDSFYISPSKQHASVMYSYPNRIPLPLSEITRISERMKALQYDTVYGFYDFQNLIGNGKEVIEASLERYR
ncbi:MAG: MBL fold metallo-hydrolase [Citrobacter freundii]|nr:MAG: MBL fold metallo-hydrolase [Citrobacter freundii]